MAYLGMLSEFDFQAKVSHGIWSLIYQNYNPEDYAMALGPEKAQQLQLMSPDQVAQNFRMIPKGIFESENKAKRQAQIGALTQQFGQFPWFNMVGSAKAQIAAADEDEASFILPEADAMQIQGKAQEMAQGMAQQQVQEQMQNQQADAKKKEQGQDPEKGLDRAAARYAVSKKLVDAKEASRRLSLKHGSDE